MPASAGRKTVLLCVAALLALSLCYDLRLTLNRGLVITDDIFASDLMNDRYPVRVELGRGLKSGRLPLWTSLIYGGFPLQANPESGITYPVNLVFFGLLAPSWALNLSIVLKFFLAGLFMFLYLQVIGVDPRACLFGAVAFSWCGFFVSHLKHLNMHDAAIWVPLLLYLLERYRRRRSLQWILLAAAVLGLQILAGHPQISYYTVLLVIAYFIWIEWPSWKTFRPASRAALYLLALLALGAGLGMVQLLPGYELTRWSERSAGVSLGFAVQYKYWLPNLLSFIYPFANGDPGLATYRGSGIFWEDYGYVGLLPLFFAFYAGIAGFRRDPRARFFAITALASFVLMLGDQALVFKALFYVLPGMKYFRFSQRFILFFDLSLAALAGIGLARALRDRPAWLFLACIGLAVPDLYIMQKRQNPVVDRRRWEAPTLTARALRTDPESFRVFSLGGSESHVSAYVMSGGWEGDLSAYIRQRNSLQPSANMLERIASSTGYINLVPRHLIRLWGNEKVSGLITKTGVVDQKRMEFLPRDPFLEVLSLYHSKYIVSIWSIRRPELEPVGQFEGFLLYRNQAVRPRAFFLPRARSATDAEAESLFLSGGIDFRREVLVCDTSFEDNGSDAAPAATVSLTERSAERLEIEVDAAERGWLFLSDTYYPGWRATLDGRPVRIHRANICGRAVPVGPGRRRIVFTFRPQSFFAGLWVSLACLALIAAGSFYSLVRDKSRHPDKTG